MHKSAGKHHYHVVGDENSDAINKVVANSQAKMAQRAAEASPPLRHEYTVVPSPADAHTNRQPTSVPKHSSENQFFAGVFRQHSTVSEQQRQRVREEIASYRKKGKFHSKHLKMWDSSKRSTLQAKVAKLFKDYYDPKKKAIHPKRHHPKKAKDIKEYADTCPTLPALLAKLYEFEKVHQYSPGSFYTRLLFSIDNVEAKVRTSTEVPQVSPDMRL